MAKPPKVPAGYREVQWVDLEPGVIVYRLGSGEPIPYRVINPTTRIVSKLAGDKINSEVIADLSLCVKPGPLIVIMTAGSRFSGIYTDIPAEIAVLGCKKNDQVAKIRRPALLDQVPTTGVAELMTNQPVSGWPSLYGCWDVVSAAKVEDKFRFNISNRLVAGALVFEMMGAWKAFTMKPSLRTPSGCYEFTVTREVLQWLQAHIANFGDGPFSPVRGGDVT